MAIQYTPALGLPYPEVTDAPLIASRDLRALAQKMDSEGAQIRGESTAALTAGEAAEALAAAALARAEKVEFPIESGTTPPEDEDKLWVDEGADGGGTVVTSEDISDATTVGRNVLTAPLAANARNALAIFTGTRALLDEGTDTAERTWDAKELHEYVTDQVAAGGGAASWDDLTGKPTNFPPAAHTHDDRYYTEAEVDAKTAALSYSTGWRRVTPPTGSGYAFDGTGSVYFRRRAGGSPSGVGDSVDIRFENVGILAGTATNAYLTPTYWIPDGFWGWYPERSWYLVGNVNANAEYKIGVVQSHRIRLSPTSPVPGTGVAALQGTITYVTDSPRPATLPGAAHTF